MISVGRYRFKGPFYDVVNLRPMQGIYAILDKRPDGNYVLDVGESENVLERVRYHERQTCWEQARLGMLAYTSLYLPNSSKHQRLMIESELRRQFLPTCGVR